MCFGPFRAFQAFYIFSVSLLTYNQTCKKNFNKFKITINFNIIKLVKKKTFRIE